MIRNGKITNTSQRLTLTDPLELVCFKIRIILYFAFYARLIFIATSVDSRRLHNGDGICER
jgi:hypothetical protein